MEEEVKEVLKGQGPGEEVEPGEAEVKEPEDQKDPTIDDLAREQGWKPKDEFTGHEDDWVDGTQYIRNGKGIQDTKRKQLKDNRRTMTSMGDQLSTGLQSIQEHNAQVRKAEETRHRAEIAKLRKERRTAIEDGDANAVEDIEERLGEEYSAMPETPKPTEKRADPAEMEAFDKWVDENPWYRMRDGTPLNEITRYAEAQSGNPDYDGLSFTQIRSRVTAKVKKMFPDKFEKETPKVPRVASVEAGRPVATAKKTKTLSASDLSDEERAAGNSFVRMKVWDTPDKKLTDAQAMQKYMKELAEIKEAT